MVTLTKVPAIPEAWNFAWDIFLPSLNYGKIGESQCQSLGRFIWRNMEWLTKDRKIWKGKVKERVKHLKKWEESKGKRWSGEAVDRNELNVDIGVYEWSFIQHECWQFQTTSNQLKTTD